MQVVVVAVAVAAGLAVVEEMVGVEVVAGSAGAAVGVVAGVAGLAGAVAGVVAGAVVGLAGAAGWPSAEV